MASVSCPALSLRSILQSGSFAPHPVSTRSAAPGMTQRSAPFAGSGVLATPVSSAWPRLNLPVLCLCGGWLELCCPRRQTHLMAILVGPPPPSPQSLASLSVAGHYTDRDCRFRRGGKHRASRAEYAESAWIAGRPTLRADPKSVTSILAEVVSMG